MPFATTTKVRFAQVDPAGIVFYPRYFEMLNGAVEDWFEQEMGLDFSMMHLEQGIGVPTVKLEATFIAPSRLGDVLTISITPREIGRTSCALTIVFTGGGTERLRAEVVLVCMDLDTKRPMPWPEMVRERMQSALAPV